MEILNEPVNVPFEFVLASKPKLVFSPGSPTTWGAGLGVGGLVGLITNPPPVAEFCGLDTVTITLSLGSSFATFVWPVVALPLPMMIPTEYDLESKEPRLAL